MSNHEIPITTIMTKDVITLGITDGLAKAEHLFKKHKIRHIPVVENKKIVGILSLNDLLRISFADGAYKEEGNVESSLYEMFNVSQLMARNLETISPDNTIREVAEILVQREFHALPVTKAGELLGMVTTTDLIKYFLQRY